MYRKSDELHYIFIGLSDILQLIYFSLRKPEKQNDLNKLKVYLKYVNRINLCRVFITILLHEVQEYKLY